MTSGKPWDECVAEPTSSSNTKSDEVEGEQHAFGVMARASKNAFPVYGGNCDIRETPQAVVSPSVPESDPGVLLPTPGSIRVLAVPVPADQRVRGGGKAARFLFFLLFIFNAVCLLALFLL